jgi:hypothetical protein
MADKGKYKAVEAMTERELCIEHMEVKSLLFTYRYAEHKDDTNPMLTGLAVRARQIFEELQRRRHDENSFS